MNLFFSYFGGKTGTASRYPAPKRNDIVIEPFAGAAGYSTHYEAERVYLFDTYPVVVEVWRYLINAANDPHLANQLRDLPVGPFYKWNPIPDDLPLGAQYLMGFWETQSQTYPSRWQQSPRIYQDGTPRPKNRGGLWNDTTRQRIVDQLPRIANWKIFPNPYWESQDILKRESVDIGNTIWHIDPPYQNGGKRYKESSLGIDFHHLGKWVRGLDGHVMVCERDPADWLDFTVLSSNKNASNRQYSELVWLNEKLTNRTNRGEP